MMIKKIGMALSIAQFTYQIIKDLAKLQNPKTHSIAEHKAKKSLAAKGHKVISTNKHVGKSVRQKEMWIKKRKKSEQKDG